MSRLQKLHQASDVLRRTSRFVTLTRRLQLQMTDMEQSTTEDTENAVEGKDGLPTSITDNTLFEDVKERAIAKAALSIAELGMSPPCTFSPVSHKISILN